MMTDKFIEQLLHQYFNGNLTPEDKDILFEHIKLDPSLDDTIQFVLQKMDADDVKKFLDEKALMCDTIVMSEEDETAIELFLSGMMEPDEEDEFKKRIQSDEEFHDNALAQAFLFKAMQKIRKADEDAIDSAKELSKSDIQNLFAELKEEDDDELIDNYLKGKLSVAEEAEFKNRIQTDSNLKERASAIAMLYKGIHLEQERAQNAIADAKKLDKADIIATIKPAAAKASKKPLLSSVWKYIAVAAAVVILALVGIDYHNYTQAPMVAEENLQNIIIAYNADDGSSRGDGDSMYKEIQTLLEAVKPNTDLKSTIEKLENHYVKATDGYADEEDQYIDIISYALATAYVYDGERDKAKKLLNKIINDENTSNDIKEKAQKLVESINKPFIF